MRVKFSEKQDLIDFFKTIQNKCGRSWKEIYGDLGIKRYSFDRYKSGESLIPEEIFWKLMQFLDRLEKEKIDKKIEKLENNWGKSLGGKKAVLINKKKFEEGRNKGLERISRIRIQKEKEFQNSLAKIEISEEICELAGAFIGDGFFNCYNNKNYQIEFTGDKILDLEYHREVIKSILKKYFPNIEVYMYVAKSKGHLRTRIYSKEVFCFLKDFLGFVPGKKCYNIRIPNKIMGSPKKYLYATIRGIFDTDGGVYFDKRNIYSKNYPRICFSTVSKELFLQLSDILSKDFKIYSRYNEKRKNYVLEIYGHNQLKKWMSLIGFSNPRHCRKCLDGLKA